MIQTTQDYMDGILAAILTAGEPIVGCSIGLYQNDLPLGPQVVFGDVIPADFDGYAAEAVGTWETGTRANGERYIVAPSVTFVAGAALAAAQTVRGFYLFDGTDLLAFAPFDTVQNIDHVGQILDVVPEYALNSLADGAGVALTS